jgi:excisionase family DNA binding protein
MPGKEHPAPEPSHRPSPKFLTVQEVAELLRISVRTVYDMVSQRRIPYRKAGDRTIFDLDEILEWTKPDEAR